MNMDTEARGKFPLPGMWTDAVMVVKGVDFTGKVFDGPPFTAMPDWLVKALNDDRISGHTRGATDYAQWDVMTPKGIVNAAPGDWIIRRSNGDLSVVGYEDYKALTASRIT